MRHRRTGSGRLTVTGEQGGILMAEKRRNSGLSLRRIKTFLPAGVPQRKILPQKGQNRSSPAHTSRGMPIPLLDMMSRSPGRQNRLNMTLIISQSRMAQSQKAGRTVMMCGIVTAVFRVMHRKRQGRKQNPVRKSADSKSSSREKTALWERKRNLTVAMLTVRQKAVFPKSRMSLQSRTLL